MAQYKRNSVKALVALFAWCGAVTVLVASAHGAGIIARGIDCPPPGPCAEPEFASIPPNGVCGLSNYVCCLIDFEIGYWGDPGNGNWVYGICCPVPTLSCNWGPVWRPGKSGLTCECLFIPCDPGGLEPCD